MLALLLAAMMLMSATACDSREKPEEEIPEAPVETPAETPKEEEKKPEEKPVEEEKEIELEIPDRKEQLKADIVKNPDIVGQNTGVGPVVTESQCHAVVGSFVVVLYAAFGSYFRVSQQEVTDPVAFGVFPFGGNRPGGGTGYGNGVSQVIGVGRTGSELCIYSVVGMQSTAVFGHQSCQGVTLGNQSHIAQGIVNGFAQFFIHGSGSSSSGGFCSSISAGRLSGNTFGSDFAVVGYNAPYGPTHNFGVLTGDFVVSIVRAVKLTGNVY